MNALRRFLREHHCLPRRYFLRLGAAGVGALGLRPLATLAETPPELAEALAKLESFLTPPAQIRDEGALGGHISAFVKCRDVTLIRIFRVRLGRKKVGQYVVHYADGQKRQIPLVTGHDLVNYWRSATEPRRPDEQLFRSMA